jgi:hypothetical protein
MYVSFWLGSSGLNSIGQSLGGLGMDMHARQQTRRLLPNEASQHITMKWEFLLSEVVSSFFLFWDIW